MEKTRKKLPTLRFQLISSIPKQMKAYQDMVGIVTHQLKCKKQGNVATVHAEEKHVFQVPDLSLKQTSAGCTG